MERSCFQARRPDGWSTGFYLVSRTVSREGVMTDANSGSKIARVMEKYHLEGMAADLEAKWTREDPDERYSLREFETHFNTAVVRSVLPC